MALNAALFALFVAQAGTGGKPTGAEEALRKSFERRLSNNVEAVVEQLSPWGGGYSKLRLWRDVAGRRRTEVLTPAAMQGRVSVDDGTNWTTYYPDTRTIRVHPSPTTEVDDLEYRMRLLRRNYRLESEAKTVVAGRSALRIIARPLATELSSQRFYIDAATFTPLKVETLDERGGVAVQFRVLHVAFPATLEADTFQAPTGEGARRELSKPPQKIKGLDEAERRLGFRPVFPRRLPLGFRPQGMALLDWHGTCPMVIRLTDGLVQLHVYQFRVKEGVPAFKQKQQDRVVKEVGDLRIEVRGDASMAVRERVLAAFVRALEGNGNP